MLVAQNSYSDYSSFYFKGDSSSNPEYLLVNVWPDGSFTHTVYDYDKEIDIVTFARQPTDGSSTDNYLFMVGWKDLKELIMLQ